MNLKIVISTRNVNVDDVKSKVCKSLSNSSTEFFVRYNNNEYALADLYNEYLFDEKHTDDVLVFIHDDIYLEQNWDVKLLTYFEDNSYGVIGLAGTRYLSDCQWWKHRESMIGQVWHKNEGKWGLNKYSNKYPNQILPAVVVDGLFMAVRPSMIEKPFRKLISKFHFYDVLFCLDNFNRGVKIGVVTDIDIKHDSIGQITSDWKLDKMLADKQYSFPIAAPIDLQIAVPVDIPQNDIDASLAIIIPSKNNFALLETCIDSIQKTNHKKYHIFIADTGSGKTQLDRFKAKMNGFDNVSVIEYDYYHFAKINNDVVSNHCSEYDVLLFCNDDVELKNDAITLCLNTLQSKDVGTVGCRLHYPNGRIQHCGIYISDFDLTTKTRIKGKYQILHKFYRGQYLFNKNIDEVFGNTGAFLMINRDLFLDAGGFDEKFTECFEDVKLNIELLNRGKLNLCNNYAVGIHHESYTRKKSEDMKFKSTVDFNKLKPLISEIERNGILNKYLL